ncbi:MAG: hypothetical protein C0614_00860 [Desulfuromonas sp.]|nr:MAG: hypothetical protein C0614_00860 [Desulfuromonas sp.]
MRTCQGVFTGPLVVAVGVLLACLCVSCLGQTEIAPEKAVTESEITAEGTVAFLAETGDELARVAVEIADDDATRSKGLMNRRSLPSMTGMLFVYEENRPRSFWMKNTYIPLDMIFLDRDGKIVNIVEKTQPLSVRSCRSVLPARYVIEVNAGFCEKYGVAVGGIVWLERF